MIDDDLRLSWRVEFLPVLQFVMEWSTEALDIAVLPRVAWLRKADLAPSA